MGISELTLSPDDNSFDLEMLITAHHWGWSEFRLCTEGAGKGPDGTGVTQECFNQNVLTFDTEDAKKRYPTKNMTDASLPVIIKALRPPCDVMAQVLKSNRT